MFAIAAAIVFLVGLIFDWADVRSTDLLNAHAFMLLGLLLISLHLAGFGAGWRGSRPGPG